MKKLLSMLLVAVGVMAAGAASTACIIIMLDEPEMPKSLLR
jgi:cyclic lactone autoinducer peptide